MSASTIIKCFDDLFFTYGICGFVHSDRWSAFKSEELKTYFLSKGVASSMSTPYHPTGNAQVERYNGVVWNAVKSYTTNNNIDIKHWERILPHALHSIRSLLCTSTNQTPHERFFNFTRRSVLGTSLPSWLTTPGPVLLRNFIRQNKHEPLVQKVQLTEANPMYARVRFSGGREANVSLRDLAPCQSGSMPDDLPSQGTNRTWDTRNVGTGEDTYESINPDGNPPPSVSTDGGPVSEVVREEQGGSGDTRGNINPSPNTSENSLLGHTSTEQVFEPRTTSHNTHTQQQRQ